MPITDTSPEAQAIQLDIYKKMSGEQRLILALEMSVFVRDLAKVRIRKEHPEWPESEVTREILRMAFFPGPIPDFLR